MAKAKKTNQAAGDRPVENREPVAPDPAAEFPPATSEPPSATSEPPPACECQRDRLWELYVARVAKAETVNTMRRDGKAIFRDAFIEAKCAHEVWVDMTNGGNEK